MAFKTKDNDGFNYSTPQEMYQDNKLKNIMGPIDYQSMMIDKYMKVISNSNIAMELPTGSGKTLISLLIGEFRRRKNKEKILYLCPTNQLVHQVVEQAKSKYGINVVAFCGKQKEYDIRDKTSYDLSKTIGVTTYSSFFSMGTYFQDPDIIILDDVHSSEDYISSNWTVDITKRENEVLFMQLAEFLKEILSTSNYERLICNDEDIDSNDWCDLIPMPLLREKTSILLGILQTNIKKYTSNFYSFERIKDNLEECNFYVKNNEILIRPWIPPTLTHLPFRNAKQRIFMSATLGNSGELERIIGIKQIERLPIVDNWDKRGVGRRFFVMPDLSLGKDKYGEIILSLHKKACKSVVLVPNTLWSDAVVNLMKKNSPSTLTLSAKDIEKTKENFLNSKDAMVIMANRFDGVDFPNELCRLLFIINLPKITNLQENFLVSKLGASILFSERIKTRIIQAVGRCTRSPNDYSLVCILGDTILNDLTKDEKLQLYSPELRAEIDFGIENSVDYTSVNDILEQMHDFLERNENWEKAEDSIVKQRNKYIKEPESITIKTYNALKKSVYYEVDFQYEYWNKNYVRAFSIVKDIINELNTPRLRGYKKYWIYMAGWISYKLFIDGNLEYEIVSKNYIEEFCNDNIAIRWSGELINKMFNNKLSIKVNDNYYFGDIINKMEINLLKYNIDRKFNNMVRDILNGLKLNDGKKFEKSHNDLGNFLGYISINHDSTAAPDPYWIVNSKLCVVSEDKIYENEKSIPVKDVREAMGHREWIRTNEKLLENHAEIITVMVTNSTSIDKAALPFANNIYYLHSEDLIEWANKAMNVLRSVWEVFTEDGDSVWRESTTKKFIDSKATPKDFIDLVKRMPLVDLQAK